MKMKKMKKAARYLKSKAGFAVDTAIKVMTAVVLGSFVTMNLYGLMVNVVQPKTREKIDSMYQYTGGDGGGGGYDGGTGGGTGGGDAGPALIYGDGSVLDLDNAADLRFVSNAEFFQFKTFNIDGNPVAQTEKKTINSVPTDVDNFKATSGSTRIDVFEEYLLGLAPGEHTISIVSTSGVASGTFTVKAASGIKAGDRYVKKDGTVINGPAAFPPKDQVQTGDVFYCGDYEYHFNQQYSVANLSDMSRKWEDKATTIRGWSVIVREESRNKNALGAIRRNIAGHDVVWMYGTFMDCKNLLAPPSIPGHVRTLQYAFYGCSNLQSVPRIPATCDTIANAFMYCTELRAVDKMGKNIKTMHNSFNSCTNLEVFTATIPKTVTVMNNTFRNCAKLGGTMKINATIQSGGNVKNCFWGVVAPLTLTGSCANMNFFTDSTLGNNRNNNITVAP